MMVPMEAMAAVAVPEIAPNTAEDSTMAEPMPPRPVARRSTKATMRPAMPPACIR